FQERRSDIDESPSNSSTRGLFSKITKSTVVRKNSTPKCVMCEMYPRTASAYTVHLQRHHKTSLKQMGFFLICSCGHEVRSNNSDPEHTKKCNGYDYSLHN
ncbi:hypothetical protein PENTCL1PPCAC_8803, partial [Pristionchus entomophagus]